MPAKMLSTSVRTVVPSIDFTDRDNRPVAFVHCSSVMGCLSRLDSSIFMADGKTGESSDDEPVAAVLLHLRRTPQPSVPGLLFLLDEIMDDGPYHEHGAGGLIDHVLRHTAYG